MSIMDGSEQLLAWPKEALRFMELLAELQGDIIYLPSLPGLKLPCSSHSRIFYFVLSTIRIPKHWIASSGWPYRMEERLPLHTEPARKSSLTSPLNPDFASTIPPLGLPFVNSRSYSVSESFSWSKQLSSIAYQHVEVRNEISGWRCGGLVLSQWLSKKHMAARIEREDLSVVAFHTGVGR